MRRNDNLKPIHKQTIHSEHQMTSASSRFGDYRKLVAAQTTNPHIRATAQNGGAVTALLVYSLENRIIDGAIVSAISKDKPFYPMPKLATTKEEIIQSAGTRYNYSPNIQALTETKERNRRAVAFVGTPCQIRAIRRMQQSRPKDTESIKLLVGLMCTEALDYEGLMGHYLTDRLGINLKDIEKTEIGGKMTITARGKKTIVPVATVKKYVRNACKTCDDFSSELADISAGGLGLSDWTFMIIRTEIGEQTFNQAEKANALATRPIVEDEPSFKLLLKLSEAKHKRTKNE